MPNYRRTWHIFFTVNLLERKGNELLVSHINTLRETLRSVKQRHPFKIHAWVVLPEHMHCILELPAGDIDFPLRWRLIKMEFSKQTPKNERLSATRK
jgi:putative transposase